jgi:hypothetical protein
MVLLIVLVVLLAGSTPSWPYEATRQAVQDSGGFLGHATPVPALGWR